MNDIIKQKINNGEGKIQLQNHGLVDASEYAERNHPNWNQSTIDEFQSKLAIIRNKMLTPEAYKLELQQLNDWLQTYGVAQNLDWQEWTNDPIIWQPTKNDYKSIESEEDDLILKTVEDRIIEIQYIAIEGRIKIKKELDDMQALKDNSNGEWTPNLEAKLVALQAKYDESKIDLQEGTTLLQACSTFEDVKLAKETLKPVFKKYDINI